jgi:hypothetical protein
MNLSKSHAMQRRRFSLPIVLSCIVFLAVTLGAESEVAELVSFQKDSNLATGKEVQLPWHKSVGRVVTCQGVYRSVYKGYYDTLMLNNTSLVIVWNKGDSRPEDGTPVQMQGKFVSVTFGGGPSTSQRAPQARAYGLQDVTWKEVRRVKDPFVLLVE